MIITSLNNLVLVLGDSKLKHVLSKILFLNVKTQLHVPCRGLQQLLDTTTCQSLLWWHCFYFLSQLWRQQQQVLPVHLLSKDSLHQLQWFLKSGAKNAKQNIWLTNTKLKNQKSLWLLQDAYPRGMLRGFCLQLRMIWILHIYHLTSSNNKKEIHKCADITDHGLSSYLVLSIDIVSVCIFSMKSRLIYLEHNYSC